MFQPWGMNSGLTESRGEVISGDSNGTTITGGGSSNTKGSWATLGSTTSFAYEALTVCIRDTAGINGLMDIGYASGANVFVVVPDLYMALNRYSNELGFILTLPIHVPAGVQISARWQGNAVSPTARCHVIGHACGLGGAPGFSRAVQLFTAQATSFATAIDPGGSANTKGSWTQMVASSSADIAGMFGLIGNNSDIARAAAARAVIDIGYGASGFESVLYPNILIGWSTAHDGPVNCPRIPPFACTVAANSRIAARAQASITTAGDRTFDLALYGLVP